MFKKAISFLSIFFSLSSFSLNLEDIEEVNNYFNDFKYIPDIELKSVNDHWSSPEEFLNDKAGDCEDFAIAKYFKLKELGVKEESLRLFYVLYKNEGHMVLAYYDNKMSSPYILDNINKRVLKSEDRDDLRPVYSFNSSKVFVNNQFSEDSSSYPLNIKRFQKILNRK